MNHSGDSRKSSSLDDETPGSQGEIEAGSEGDFGDPERTDDDPGGEPTDAEDDSTRM